MLPTRVLGHALDHVRPIDFDPRHPVLRAEGQRFERARHLCFEEAMPETIAVGPYTLTRWRSHGLGSPYCAYREETLNHTVPVTLRGDQVLTPATIDACVDAVRTVFLDWLGRRPS